MHFKKVVIWSSAIFFLLIPCVIPVSRLLISNYYCSPNRGQQKVTIWILLIRFLGVNVQWERREEKYKWRGWLVAVCLLLPSLNNISIVELLDKMLSEQYPFSTSIRAFILINACILAAWLNMGAIYLGRIIWFRSKKKGVSFSLHANNIVLNEEFKKL